MLNLLHEWWGLSIPIAVFTFIFLRMRKTDGNSASSP